MIYYDNYYIWGMHLIWWLVWLILLFWIFALPYRIPGQRYHRDSPIQILDKRFARGEMNNIEYQEKKKLMME